MLQHMSGIYPYLGHCEEWTDSHPARRQDSMAAGYVAKTVTRDQPRREESHTSHSPRTPRLPGQQLSAAPALDAAPPMTEEKLKLQLMHAQDFVCPIPYQPRPPPQEPIRRYLASAIFSEPVQVVAKQRLATALPCSFQVHRSRPVGPSRGRSGNSCQSLVHRLPQDTLPRCNSTSGRGSSRCADAVKPSTI